ncbi:hypothetical protein FEF65_04695 [Mariprofundus erugo]|uniref:Uncharacterized protein n=1 Tax=Mariprofundus erugo TaxID=2528639 RepID=A0A5R9GTC2_9PROT|nr:hypothetical protein [Mariprofundus erugo]TLS68295.1 hypothetical protein FEF65_04695 [Mariprofundus erugo]
MSTPLRTVIILALMLLSATASVIAAPSFEIIAPDKEIEKSHTFQLLVKVTTDAKLSAMSIAPIYPQGFCMEVVLIPGVTATEHAKPERLSADTTATHPVAECTGIRDIAHVAVLDKNSMIIPFTVYPPDSNGMPETGDKRSYYSTRDKKTFAFNYAYRIEHDDGSSTDGHASQEIRLRYTTTIGYYLLAGLFGVFLGYTVKVTTRDRQEIGAAMTEVRGFFPRLRRFAGLLLIERLPMLLTLLVIGFAVLISMAQESLPVASWHQAVALGIGLGILGDEKLIAAIK